MSDLLPIVALILILGALFVAGIAWVAMRHCDSPEVFDDDLFFPD